MSWLNNFLGDNNSNNNLSDKDFALDMLNASKGNLVLLTKVITEAATPTLRTMLTNQLTNCITDHFKLADIAAQKNWYNPYTSPGQQIKQDLQEVQNILQNENQQDQNQQNQNQQG